MSDTITATVRDAYQSYTARGAGKTASSTSGPQWALERLAEQVFGAGKHNVQVETECTAAQAGRYVLVRETATVAKGRT